MPSHKLRNLGFYGYVVAFLIFLIRYFVFDLSLGYGLGDMVYLALFSFWMVLTTAQYIVAVQRKRANLIMAWLNVAMSIYLVLMMFVFTGPETG